MLKHAGPLVQTEPAWHSLVQFKFSLVALKLTKQTALNCTNTIFTASVNTLSSDLQLSEMMDYVNTTSKSGENIAQNNNNWDIDFGQLGNSFTGCGNESRITITTLLLKLSTYVLIQERSHGYTLLMSSNKPSRTVKSFDLPIPSCTKWLDPFMFSGRMVINHSTM